MDSRRALERADPLTPKGRSARSRAVACGLRSSLLSVQALDGRYALESRSQRTIEAVRTMNQLIIDTGIRLGPERFPLAGWRRQTGSRAKSAQLVRGLNPLLRCR
jgi:hypothetical protein